MQEQLHKTVWKRGCGLVAAFGLLLACPLAGLAQETDPADSYFVPFPLAHSGNTSGLAFDLGGSDVRKLQLQLDRPLSLQTVTRNGLSAAQTSSLLSMPLDANGQLAGQSAFTALGSIHCVNGTLAAGSYHASDCYFIDEPSTLNSQQVSIGAQYRANDHVSAGINLFHSETGFSQGYSAQQSVQFDPATLRFASGNPLLDGAGFGPGPQQLDSELTGVDLEFQVGVSTDRAGDMVLGLQLTRITDATFESLYSNSNGIQNWTIAEPVDSARLSFDWSMGSFSGGIESYYRAPIDFMNRSSLEDYATFDVHFSWRAPWNASLSVGAANLLGAGSEESVSEDSTLNDPFESIYGRIPYVRYKQDL